jgi:hypothetical protein
VAEQTAVAAPSQESAHWKDQARAVSQTAQGHRGGSLSQRPEREGRVEPSARARSVIVSKGLTSSARVDPPARVTPGLLREPPPLPPPAPPPEDLTHREILSPARQAGRPRGSPPLVLPEPRQALPPSQRGVPSENLVCPVIIERSRDLGQAGSAMIPALLAVLASFGSLFRSRAALQAEVFALRHQLLVLERQHTGKPIRLRNSDRLLWA